MILNGTYKDYEYNNTQWFLLRTDLGEERDASVIFTYGFRLKGQLDYARLERAVQRLVDENEIFRLTCVEKDGKYYQRVFEKGIFKLVVDEAEGNTEEERYKNAEDKAWAIARTPMNIFEEGMFEVSLKKISDEDHILVVTLHHAIIDGKSGVDTITQILRYYADETAKKDEITATFIEFLEDEKAFLDTDAGKKQLAYWESELGGYKPITLPMPEVIENFNSADVPKSMLDKKGLDALATQEKTSMFNILLTAYHVALTKVYGVSDTMIGFSCANRLKKKYLNTIGYLSRAVQNRLIVNDDDTLIDLLRYNTKKISENIVNQRTAHLNQNDDSQFFITISDFAAKKKDETIETPIDVLFKALQVNGVKPEVLDFSIPRKLEFLTLAIQFTDELVIPVTLGDTQIFERKTLIAISETLKNVINAFINNPHVAVKDI